MYVTGGLVIRAATGPGKRNGAEAAGGGIMNLTALKLSGSVRGGWVQAMTQLASACPSCRNVSDIVVGGN